MIKTILFYLHSYRFLLLAEHPSKYVRIPGSTVFSKGSVMAKMKLQPPKRAPAPAVGYFLVDALMEKSHYMLQSSSETSRGAPHLQQTKRLQSSIFKTASIFQSPNKKLFTLN
jgi:hypothetical protein